MVARRQYLAFTSSRPGKAKGSQVWLLDRRGGEAQQLTDVKQDLDSFRWSPGLETAPPHRDAQGRTGRA